MPIDLMELILQDIVKTGKVRVGAKLLVCVDGNV